jgi:hypothetical protein
MTVAEMASMGGRPRAVKYTREQLRAFAKNAGRPVKSDGKARQQLKQILASGKSQAQCARTLGVSVRTISRVIAGAEKGNIAHSMN